MKFNGAPCRVIGWKRIKSLSHPELATRVKCKETQRADNRNLVYKEITAVSNKL